MSEVVYTVTGNGADLSGTIDVTDPNATASVEVELPEASGYTITMSATTSDGSECVGSATFDIVAQTLTTVNLTLFCEDEEDLGGAIINGEFVPDDGCPDIAFKTAAPVQTSVGSDIAVNAGVTPAGTDVSFMWTATSGTFADPNAAMTSFTCTQPGPAELTVTVTRGTACEDSASVVVHCIGDALPDAGAGGAGGDDAGTGGAGGTGGTGGTGGAGGTGGDDAGAGGTGGTGGAGGDAGIQTFSAVGTWLTPQLMFDTSIEAPVVGTADLGVELMLAVRVAATGELSAQVCMLDFEETALGLEFVDSVQEIQTTTALELPTTEYVIGEPFPVTDLLLAAEDLEVNATAIGLMGLLVDLQVPIELDGTFEAQGSVEGTTSFSSTGNVFAGMIPLGALSIPAPTDPVPEGPFQSIQVSGDPTLNCEDALAAL